MQTSNGIDRLPASFRDPAGFLFLKNGVLYRQINRAYHQQYTRLLDSGLYRELVGAGLLVRHEESDQPPLEAEVAFKVIRPDRVPFVSYPYEWSFGQLKDAALVTLAIQKQAMKFGMILKDASAYNFQFSQGKPVLIDTLSFDLYEEGKPWDAYRQFCQHFLAPLALMAYRDVRLGQLSRVYLDGIPLDLTAELLPLLTRGNLGLLTHIHIHAAAQKRYAGKPVKRALRITSTALKGLVENLEKVISDLTWQPLGTEWGDYYDCTNYSDHSLENKKALVRKWTDNVRPDLVFDLGANTGMFSRESATSGALIISMDLDPAAVEQNYQAVKRKKEFNILPLLLDLTNPTPQLGWNLSERDSFHHRGPADLTLALALVHHLAISNNIPLPYFAEFLAGQCRWLIVEFVPKTDSQVQKLLASRKDIFSSYSQEGFESAFAGFFETIQAERPGDSDRTLYFMKRR
ncbi:MAG: SAM-dependent methyltransferase [Chloroflexi bacterium]|nr:SAM-dependent methyltransferase [Chloroflexota bacterium]